MGVSACKGALRNCGEDPLSPSFEPIIAGGRAVVLVHGMMSCAMLSRQRDSGLGLCPGCCCCCKPQGWQLAYVNVSGYTLRCEPLYLLDSLQLETVPGTLIDGTQVTTTADLPGVLTRAVEGPEGIRTLNPGNFTPVRLWADLIDTLSPDYNLTCLNYDWRRWGDLGFAEELFHQFRKSIVAAAAVGGPVSIITHSMGSNVALYYLSKLGTAWTRRYVSQLIMVAPAVMGCPYMFSYLGGAPSKLLHKWLPEAILEAEEMLTTWPCIVAEFPQAIGTVQPWPTGMPFVVTPSQSYGVADVGSFFDDVAKQNGRQIGRDMWPGVQALGKAIVAPEVELHAIYGSGVETTSQVEWDNDAFSGEPKVRASAPGDDTLLASTMLALAEAWKSLQLHEIKGAVSHKGLIMCAETLALLPQLLGSRT